MFAFGEEAQDVRHVEAAETNSTFKAILDTMERCKGEGREDVDDGAIDTGIAGSKEGGRRGRVSDSNGEIRSIINTDTMPFAMLGIEEEEEGEGEHSCKDADDDSDARAEGGGEGVERGRGEGRGGREGGDEGRGQ